MSLSIPPEFKNGEKITIEKGKFNGKKEIIEYIKGKKIGKGGFSVCYEFFCLNDKRIYAAKEIKVNDCDESEQYKRKIEMIRNEIKIYEFLEHKNIIEQKDHFIYNGSQYLIFEMCKNKDLANLLKVRGKLKEIEVQYYIRQLIDALTHLQESYIIHRDLKLENIFLTEKMELKLGDFGLAKKLSSPNDILKEEAGTPNYMAPELLEKIGYSLKVDIWAIGIIMYYLIIGKPPFDKANREENIKNLNFKFKENAIISEVAKDLINQILVKDPKKRPDLYQILRHDFFKLGRSIPKFIPTIFMEKEPSISYIRNFMEDANKDGIVNREASPIRLINIKIEKDDEKDNNKNRPDIYVTKCKEIKKYGLGYRLSNNKYGVCFNDCTKMLFVPMSNEFFYAENKDYGNYYKINDPDLPKNKDLDKKFKILQSFEEVLRRDKNSSIISQSEGRIVLEENQYEKREDNPLYVKKYYSFDDKSILIRLNNKDIQVYFNNGEHILLSKEEKEITFIKKNQNELESLKFPLQDIMETQNYEIIRKLQYAKNILERVLTEDLRS